MIRTWSGKTGDQEAVLLQYVYALALSLAASDVPVTFIQYPYLTQDAGYLYRKLKPVLHEVDFESFKAAYQQTLRPELVNRFIDNS